MAPSVLDIVDRIMRQGTMRLTLASRRGSRAAESKDERAIGVATPDGQVALVEERLLSQRMLEERIAQTAQRMAEMPAHIHPDVREIPREASDTWIFLYERGSWMHVEQTGMWSSRMHRVGDPRAPRDPLWILDALRGATTCESIGSDEVRGEQTRRYRLQVDLAAAHRRVPSGLKDGSTKIMRLTQSSVRKWRTSMPTEIWVDQEGRLRRATWLRNPIRDARPAERRDELWTTLDLWDFGVPAPPPIGRPGKPADDALNYLASLPASPESTGS